MVLVSVIIPVYNVEKYLSECLDSLSRQQFTDAEFICIDDGSEDRSLEICNKYAEKDSRFKVISQSNSGPAEARNVGIDVSSGKYIWFIDSDDYIEDGVLEKLCNLTSDGKYDVIIHGANVVDDLEPIPDWIVKATSPKSKEISDFEFEKIFEIDGCRPFLWLHFIKSELIKDNGLRFDEKLHIGEDQAFEILYLSKAKTVLFIEDKMYNYRMFRSDSTMQKYSSDRMGKMWQHIEMIESVVNNLGEHITASAELALSKWTIEVMYWDMINLLYHDQARYISRMFAIFNTLNFSNHISELTDFDLLRFRHLKIIYDYSDNPEMILKSMKDIYRPVRDEVERIESSKIFKIYRLFKQ